MNQPIQKTLLRGFLVVSILLCVTLFTGCGSNGVADYNEKVSSLTGTGAGKISLLQTSNVHSISLDLIGGSVTETEDGNLVKFDNVVYTQANPIWNTKIIVEDYARVIPSGESVTIDMVAPEGADDLVRARGDEPLMPATVDTSE